MFDLLSKKFSSLFSKLSSKGTLDEATIDQSLIEVKEGLLEADVPYELVEQFAESIKQELVGKKLIGSLKLREQLLKVVHEKLLSFLGGEIKNVFTFQLPSVVMVMGLQGSGKTTTIGKLAHYVQKEAKKKNKTRRILIGSVDYYRPAAIDQLEVVAKDVGVSFYRAQNNDPVKAAQEIYDYFKQNQYELLFLDTAGRLHVDNAMLEELRRIDANLSPKHKLLVLDAMTGQESLNVAQAFDQAIGFEGAILSKTDSDTRGGAAFSFRYALKKPIYFIGTGEKKDNLDQFHPERAAGRMLGMGDIKSLLEKADEKIQESDQERVYQSFKDGSFTLDDFAKQMEMMNKLGPISSIMKYIPGMSGISVPEGAMEQGQKELDMFRAIMGSMTPKERIYPPILNQSRKDRIAKGAGVEVAQINKLLSRFEQMKQYAKLVSKPGGLSNIFRGR